MTDLQAEQCHVALAPPAAWGLVRKRKRPPFVYLRLVLGRDDQPLQVWYGGDLRWLNEAIGQAILTPRPMTDDGEPGILRMRGPQGWSVASDGGYGRAVYLELNGETVCRLSRLQAGALRLRLLQLAILAEVREDEQRAPDGPKGPSLDTRIAGARTSDSPSGVDGAGDDEGAGLGQ